MIEIAHAKLTTHLHITGVREDGYHLIDAEMVSLDLADELRFEPGDGLKIEGPSYLPTDAANLITKALAAAGTQAMVVLTKQIPVGGGLGGGSSNAAAALRWAKRPDIALAALIGADVPFCLQGGRARVRGIGDELEALEFEPREYTLLLPPFGVNTAAVYRKYDEIKGVGPGLRRDDALDVHEQNDLQAAAELVDPRLVEWRSKFAKWTGATPVLAGSGSTWFVAGAYNAPPDDELQGARWILTKTVPAQVLE